MSDLATALVFWPAAALMLLWGVYVFRTSSMPRAGLLLLGALALGAWALTQALEGATDPPPPTAEPVAPTEPTEPPPRQPTGGAPPPWVPPPARDTATPTEPPTETVTVNPLDYVGEPADDAANALREDGLRVAIQQQDGDPPDDPSSCTVTDVEPFGAVPKGSTVTLTCFESGE